MSNQQTIARRKYETIRRAALRQLGVKRFSDAAPEKVESAIAQAEKDLGTAHVSVKPELNFAGKIQRGFEILKRLEELRLEMLSLLSPAAAGK